MGAVRRHGADFCALGDLIEPFGQHGTVAVAAGSEPHRPDVRRGRLHGQMDLAPLVPALNAVPARRRVVAGPVRRAGAGGSGLRHPPYLTVWIH